MKRIAPWRRDWSIVYSERDNAMAISIRMFWVLLLLAVSTLPVPAQVPSRGWERLQQTPAAQKVKIQLQDGTQMEGTISEVGSGGITLLQKNGVRLIPFEDVAKVTHKSRAWAALWGAAIGAAITCPIGAAKAGYLTDRNNPGAGDRLGMCALFGGFFGGIGAGLGAAAGMDRTIFKPAPLQRTAPAIRR
jgi:hypothetical protein